MMLFISATAVFVAKYVIHSKKATNMAVFPGINHMEMVSS